MGHANRVSETIREALIDGSVDSHYAVYKISLRSLIMIKDVSRRTLPGFDLGALDGTQVAGQV